MNILSNNMTNSTVCPRNLVHFNIENILCKKVMASWTFSYYNSIMHILIMPCRKKQIRLKPYWETANSYRYLLMFGSENGRLLLLLIMYLFTWGVVLVSSGGVTIIAIAHGLLKKLGPIVIGCVLRTAGSSS